MKGYVGEDLEKRVIEMANEGSGSKFDKDVVGAFLSMSSMGLLS